MIVLDKWKENTSKYGGPNKERPSQGQQDQVSLTETQASLAGPETSPPGPKEDLTKKTKEEEDISTKKISNDQTPLAMVLASIKLEFTNGNIYGSAGPVYDQVFKPLKGAGSARVIAEGQSHPGWVVNLTHPDPSVFDSRTEAMLRQAFVGVLGGQVEVKIMEDHGD